MQLPLQIVSIFLTYLLNCIYVFYYKFEKMVYLLKDNQ